MCVEHQKSVTKLLGYDFEIQYRPSLENKAVDTLSHLPVAADLAIISISKVMDLGELTAREG